MPAHESLQSTAETLLRRGRAFARELEALERAAARTAGLTPAEAQALAQLLELGSVAMHDLASALRIRRSTATRLVDQLQRKGWARRLSGTEDRRQVLLEILAPGRERVLAFEDGMTQACGEMLVQLRPRERDLDLGVLTRLEEALRRWNDQNLD